MKAKRQAVIILSAVCLCLLTCAVMLALYTGDSTGSAEAADAVYSITDIPVGEIGAAAISNTKTTFGLMMSGDEILVMSEIEGNYSTAELRALVYAACHLTGSREITDLSSAEDYGINAPLARVTLIKADGTEASFSILMQNPIDGNYYLFSEDKQAIYLIAATEAELFLRQEEDFFAHTIFPAITAGNYLGVQSAAMDFNGNGRDYTLTQRAGAFYITEPIEQRIAVTAMLEKLLRYISALYADSFVATGADLSGYGFDAYTLKITLTYDSMEYTALLLEQGDGSLLMANPADDSIYRLTTPYLPELKQDYLALTGGNAFYYAAGDLRSFSVADAQSEVLFELSGAGETLTAVAGGHILDNVALTELLGKLNSVGIEKETAGPVSGEPFLRITYTLATGSTEAVELRPAADGSYSVTVNGVTNFTTTRAAAESIREAAFAYLS